MSTLEQTFGTKNKFANLFIPMIKHFNAVEKRPDSPFEKLAVAIAIIRKANNWNNSDGFLDVLPFRSCCCSTTLGLRCEDGVYFVLPCPSCQTTLSAVNTNVPGSMSYWLTAAAKSVKLPTPYTSMVNNFMFALEAIPTNNVNDYVYFQKAIDIFFANVAFISYFTNEYFDGLYSEAFQLLLAGSFRSGYNTSGFVFEKIADGTVLPTVAVTTIDCDIVDPTYADDQKYWEVYSDATNRWILYLQVDVSGTGAPAYMIIPGVTDHEIALATSSADSADLVADSIQIALNADPDWASAFETVTVENAIQVIITTLTGGSVPASDNTNQPTHDLWAMVFVDGTPGTGLKERFSIDYTYVVGNHINNKYFTIYNGVTSYMFWYNVRGLGTLPTATADFYYAIVIDDTSQTSVKLATTLALNTVGLWDIVTDDALLTIWEQTAAGVATDINGGTAVIGDGGQETNVLAPDGTDFGPAINDAVYASIWNTEVVPYLTNLGLRAYYLKPVVVKGTGAWCPISSTQNYWNDQALPCLDLPTDTNTARVGTFMLQTPYQANVDDLPFR